MDKFRIPKIPISVNKSVRFPVTMVDEVEEAIRGQDCTFSAFVVRAGLFAPPLLTLHPQNEFYE